MTYNFTTDGYIINGTGVEGVNTTYYYLSLELTPITEILLLILITQLIQIYFIARRR